MAQTNYFTYSLYVFFVITTATMIAAHDYGRGIGVNPGPVTEATKGGVWPKPQQQKLFSSYMLVNPSDFKFKVIQNNCEILQDAIRRYTKILKRDEKKKRMAKNSHMKKKKRRERMSDNAAPVYLNALDINLLLPCEDLPYIGMDEKYELKVDTPDLPKEALLTASSVWGILRGLETFSQLLYEFNSTALVLNSTSIMDFPRFPHRGLLLDTSRHYMPLKIIYKTLDAMSMNKYNVFHWHIVDDHSFPYQSIKFPALSELGAYSPKHTYSQDDVQNVIKYATFRGIRVIAEFDSPGHTRSWGQGYPELLTECYDGSEPDGSLGPMNPIVNNTYSFMDKLLDEIKNVFPDNFTHLGGDEVDYRCWRSNPDIIKYVKDNNITYANVEELYVKRIIQLAEAKGFKSIVWQEVFDNGLNVPKDTIIHIWKGENYVKEMSEVTARGYTAILSSPWYLDHVSSGGDWIKYYNVDVLGFNGTQEQKNRILGGEACMWSEHVDSTNVMTRVWPRACAAAEKLWSAANVKNYREAAKRLEEHTCRLNMRGIPAQPPNGPSFCPNVNF